MQVVAYYRTRPSEPEASKLALGLQREAVLEEIERDGSTLIAEFIEREGAAGDDGETYPAYVAAVEAVLAYRRDGSNTWLYVASEAAIGSGRPFVGLGVPDSHDMFIFLIETPLVPAPPTIPLSVGAPASLCLYADYRSSHLDTLVYLCNAGPDALSEVAAVIDTTDMALFHRAASSAERWAKLHHSQEKHWNSVPPGTCVLANTLSHQLWDVVNRYRLTFTDAAGRRRTAETNDLTLNACRLAQHPNEVWDAFDLDPA